MVTSLSVPQQIEQILSARAGHSRFALRLLQIGHGKVFSSNSEYEIMPHFGGGFTGRWLSELGAWYFCPPLPGGNETPSRPIRLHSTFGFSLRWSLGNYHIYFEFLNNYFCYHQHHGVHAVSSLFFINITGYPVSEIFSPFVLNNITGYTFIFDIAFSPSSLGHENPLTLLVSMTSISL
jgi:hypothetical protein